MSQQKRHPRWDLTKEFAGNKGKSCEGSEVRGLGESRTPRNLAWLDQEREGSGDAEKLGRSAGVSTGGAVLQPASALTTPGDTLPHFPSSGLHGLALTQPPVHSQRRPSPPRLLRWRSSSTARNPSAHSFGPASGFLGSKAGEEEPLDTRSKRACGFTPARSGRPHRGACRTLAAALCPGSVGGADGSADGRGVGRKRRRRKVSGRSCVDGLAPDPGCAVSWPHTPVSRSPIPSSPPF